MKVISINVNGIRAAARKGLFDWLLSENADIVCVQELKAQTEQLTDAVFSPSGYHRYLHPAQKKGYSGVGIYCKQKPNTIQLGLGKGFEDIDNEGRYIQTDFDQISVASLYMPSGSSKEERQRYKIAMMERFEPVLQQMRDSQRQWIICGDWNIAHKKIDIKNWRGNQKKSGFLPEERQWLDWLFDEQTPELPAQSELDYHAAHRTRLGFSDAFRLDNKEEAQYTWWSNRGQAWANNTGWRIDYQVISDNLSPHIIKGSARVYKQTRFSDHSPLIIEYDL